MYSIIIIAIIFLFYSLFDCLIPNIKNIQEYNEEIKNKIKKKELNHDAIFLREYNEKDLFTIKRCIFNWITDNITLNAISILIIFIITFFIAFCWTWTDTQYQFEITSLKDNLVTEGSLSGTPFCIQGRVDGTISYFYSKNTSKGKIINHIPCDDTYIVYDDNVHPYIEIHEKIQVFPEWLKDLTFIEYIGNNPIIDYYVITIPSGSLIDDGTFEIDME